MGAAVHIHSILLTCLALVACTERHEYVAEQLVVPERLSMVVPLLVDPHEPLARNLVYEANNALVRSGRVGFVEDGFTVATRWRSLAERTAGLFVLRDSLWNQQDHPTQHAPLHLMLPPSWLLVAASQPGATAVRSFDLEDDQGWATLADESQLFGVYPPSPTLYQLAVSNRREASGKARARITHARLSIQQLSQLTEQLQLAAPRGWRAVVTRGAELIAEGDRVYFGTKTRRDHIIPILVENPAPHEVGEGKGYVVPGLQVSDDVVRLLVSEICRLRLLDGDIALERYDLSAPEAAARALDILVTIIPRGQPGTTKVWLWVTGKLTRAKTLQGEGALEYVDEFRRKARELPINLDRVRFFNKPAEIPGSDFARKLHAYQNRSLYMSIDADTERLLAASAAMSLGEW